MLYWATVHLILLLVLFGVYATSCEVWLGEWEWDNTDVPSVCVPFLRRSNSPSRRRRWGFLLFSLILKFHELKGRVSLWRQRCRWTLHSNPHCKYVFIFKQCLWYKNFWTRLFWPRIMKYSALVVHIGFRTCNILKLSRQGREFIKCKVSNKIRMLFSVQLEPHLFLITHIFQVWY